MYALSHFKRVDVSTRNAIVSFGISLGAFFSVFLGMSLGVALSAQAMNVTITDISPNRSNKDATSANAASSGRVNGIAADPVDNAIFYVASEWGGLFKSTDSGLTWFRLDGHLPTVTWDVEVHPNFSKWVVATSFYDGRVSSQSGINISTDAGATWLHPPSSMPPVDYCVNESRRSQPSAYGISINLDVTDEIYVGTSCGLAVSKDLGVSWKYIDPTPTTPASDIWDVLVHDNTIIETCGSDGHMRSIDGGITWTTSTQAFRPAGGRCSLAVSPDEAYVIFVVSGTSIFESDDGGATWKSHTNLASQGRIPFVAVNDRSGSAFDLWFADRKLFRAGCSTPIPALPGGAARCPASNTWVKAQKGAHSDGGDIAFDTAAANNACPKLYSNDGGVYYETQGTRPDCHSPEWEQPDVTPHALWQFDLAGAKRTGHNKEDLYFGTQDTGTFATKNAGAATPSWNNRDCCDGFDVAADVDQVVYTLCCTVSSPSTKVYVRNSKMKAGQQLSTYPSGNILSWYPIDSISNFDTNGYVIITTTAVQLTSDITATPTQWTILGAVNDPMNPCGIQSVKNAQGVFFFLKNGGCNGTSPGELLRYDGIAPGGTWQSIQINASNTVGIFAVHPSNLNRIIASDLDPVAGPRMVSTTDGGVTWQSMPELDKLMIGDGQFYYANDYGPTNFTSQSGYPQPSLIAFDPIDPTIIVAAGADSGVFVTQNGGANWSLVTDPLTSNVSGVPHIPRAHHAHFEHTDLNHVNIYLGTKGRGAWRLRLYTGFLFPGGRHAPLQRFCQLSRQPCGTLKHKFERIELSCAKAGCYILDEVLSKACPGSSQCSPCGEGENCQRYHQVHLDHFKDWRVGLFKRDGTPVEHTLHRTQTGVVLSFKPDKALRNNAYVLGFQLTEKGQLGHVYEIQKRLEFSDKPYGAKSQQLSTVIDQIRN